MLGKMLSIVLTGAALLSGSKNAALPEKDIDGTIFLVNRQHVISEQYVPEPLRKTQVHGMSQSMREDVLYLNRRGHTARDVEEAAARIRDMGFSLGLQMMTGLYGDDAEGARYTARKLAELHPDTVRIYPTVVMKDTELGRLYQEGGYIPMGLEETIPLCAELLSFFESRGIRVIRLGLHDTPELKRDMLAGAYHPALRELCESYLFLDRMLSALKERLPKRGVPVRVAVHPKAISKALGQKRQNLQALKEAGFQVEFLQDASVPLGNFRIIDSNAG